MGKAIYLTVGVLPLMIIPDTQAHLNGHTVITHTYQIYKQTGLQINDEIFGQEEKLGSPDLDDADYLGHLTFDIPDKLFTYYPAKNRQLESHELDELIGILSDYRNNPAVWPTG